LKSIIQKDKKCFVCGTCINLHDHHIFFGMANRKLSEKYGLKVWLCGRDHNQSNDGVHFNRELDLYIKQVGQRAFEREHTREEFMKIFGKNYL
jgi:hypothetical protein